MQDPESHSQLGDRAPKVLRKEELGEGLVGPKKTTTPQEDQENQLTWTFGDSQRLDHQPQSERGLDLDPCPPSFPTYVAEVQLGFHAGPPTTGMEGLSLTL